MLVAVSLESTLEDLGYVSVGIAADLEAALSLAENRPDVALVDLNLRDGETGAEVGARLARDYGVGVLFVTANPRRLGQGVPGTLGVLTKPCEEEEIAAAIDYGVRRRSGQSAPPPSKVKAFDRPAA